uniref:Uncharacterized protein n=1 Tax=Anguilla anguilla TaxID=7936 RepID=A0A0E9PRT0_ANGAN
MMITYSYNDLNIPILLNSCIHDITSKMMYVLVY